MRSYGLRRNTYSALNAIAGHYNSFGADAPLPKKRLERVQKVSPCGFDMCVSQYAFAIVVIVRNCRACLNLIKGIGPLKSDNRCQHIKVLS